jgi:hypothetical protein
VRSPLQALNAIEAKYEFKTLNEIVLVFYRREIDKELILKTLSIESTFKIITQKLKPHLELFHFLNQILKEYNDIDKCFIGDYSTLLNYFMNRLHYNELVVLEDGTANIEQYNVLVNKTFHKIGKTSFKEKSPLSIFFENILKVDKKYYYNATIFTIFSLPLLNMKIVKNRYKYIKSYVNLKEKKEVCFFVGSNLIEKHNKIYDNQDLFEKDLQKIINYYKNLNIKFYYILHRKEDDFYMNSLAKRFGFQTIRFKNILEIELLNLTYMPIEISTFISSAVLTLKNIYDTQYTFFRINKNHLAFHKQESISIIQEQFLVEDIKQNTI